MSVETQAGDSPDGWSLTLRRNEGIQTVEQTLPRPARHGGAGMFVLNDVSRDAATIPWNAGEHRQIPDGSLYQHARAARYAHEDDLVEDPDGRERVVLARDYESDGEPHAIIMTDSRWRAGTGQGDDYSPWYKYDLTLRPLDEDGAIAWDRTPVEALNVKLQPQYDQLVDADGDALALPYGEGTLVHVQSTWVEHPRVLLERTQDLVEAALGYELDASFVIRRAVGSGKQRCTIASTRPVRRTWCTRSGSPRICWPSTPPTSTPRGPIKTTSGWRQS